MRKLLRALPFLILTSAFLGLVLFLQGCSALVPSYVEGALVHQSHPGAGPGPWPAGGGEDETTINGIEGVTGWDRGLWFIETGLMYNIRERRLEGGPWTVTIRTGIRVPLKEKGP